MLYLLYDYFFICLKEMFIGMDSLTNFIVVFKSIKVLNAVVHLKTPNKIT